MSARVGLAITAAVAVFLLAAGTLGLEREDPARFAELSSQVAATMDPAREQRLADATETAARIEAESGFPAEAMVAQWALESDWGARPACQHNYFGVKRSARHKAGCEARTTEVMTSGQIASWDRDHPGNPARSKGRATSAGYLVQVREQFADYASLEESFRDYAWLIQNGAPYRAAWSRYQHSGQVDDLLKSLSGVYWTDPDYVRKAEAVIADSDAREALLAARSREAPATPAAPSRGLPPIGLAALAIILGNVAVFVIGHWLRLQSRARHEEFKRRIDGVRASVEAGLSGQLARNNLDLMDKFNGRYLQTVKFEAAHQELLDEIRRVHAA